MVEAGKVYSMKPEDRKGDFTFSRSTAATRVNASGNIEKETGNLLANSSTFTSWIKSSIGVTLTSGQSGYDGSSDAYQIEKDANGFRFVRQDLTSPTGVVTFSVYMKAGTLTTATIRLLSSPDARANFNLNTGALISSSNVIDTSSEDVGNGWYRYSMTANMTTMAEQVIYPDDITTSNAGTIFVQDAQLEQGLVARDVITTTTTAIYGGITDNVPRLDYTDSSCPALLLEPQRTNAIQQSEYFNTWNTIVNMTINANQDTSPEGYDNATKLIPTTFNGEHFIDKSGFNRTAGEYISHTIYAKADGYNYLYISNAASRLYGVYNLSNGSVEYVNSNGTDFTNHSANIEDAGNGWYRCTLIGQALVSVATYMRITCAPVAIDSQGYGFAGDGTSGVLLYGAQVETNSSYATSYIPTYGSAVTRNVDAASKTGISDLINDSEGTLFVEASTLENGADCRITISDNTINNRVSIEWDANADTIKGFIGVGGNLQTTSYDQTNMNKIALVYNATDARLFINGTKVFTDSSVPSLSGMDRLEFSNYAAALPFVGNTNKLLILKEKLTDQEAIDLTTI